MNVLLRTSKQEHGNLLWEPFATSTPLKTVPGQLITQAESVNLVGKLLNVYSTAGALKSRASESKHSVPKKIKRSRLCAYFDLSSSSDEESNENKRPIIKISSKKNTRSLIKTKKIKNEETGSEINKVDAIGNCAKTQHSTVKENKKTISTLINLKHEDCKTEDAESKAKNEGVKVHSHLENSCISSDEESKIFNETKNKHLVNGTKSCSNVCNDNSYKGKNIKQQKNLKQIKNSKINRITKVSVNSVHEENTLTEFNKSQETLSKNNKLPRTVVRKRLKRKIESESIKKPSTKKVTKKLSKQNLTEKPTTPFHLLENKINSSHQLFSDSKEQECINTLNLTSEEINEPAESTACSLWQKPRKISYKNPSVLHPSVQENVQEKKDEKQDNTKKKNQKNEEFTEQENFSKNQENLCKKNLKIIKKEKSTKKLNSNTGVEIIEKIQKKNDENIKVTENKDEEHKQKEEEKQERPRRRNQKPKEFWLPENIETNKENKIKINSDISKKNEKTVKKLNENGIKVEKITKNVKQTEKLVLKDLKTVKKDKKNAIEINTKQKSVKENLITSNTDKLKSTETDCVGLDKSINKNFNSVKEVSKVSTAEGKTVDDDKTVFSLLSDLPFKDNGSGCSAAQSWNKNNFKCGVFKLKVNSQLTCKTLYNNSHLGGVVVKGILKMKIGDKELQLKEGDMAFVPPLTEWQATNICDNEAVFYYWCGRF